MCRVPVCSVFSRMSDSPISTLLARFNPSLATAIPAGDRRVVKRDGTLVPWDPARIVRAVARAFYDVQHSGDENPRRDDPATRFGLDQATFDKAQQIATRAARMLELFYRTGRHPTIEQIQDTVEKSIAAEGEWDVARSYIVYRERHAAHRLNQYTENGLSDYIAISKYARYRRELGRRESFAEASRRVLAMHLEHFKDRLALRLPPPDETTSPALPSDRRLLTEWLAGGTLSDALHRAFGAVARKRVLPSMRSLQFGGEAILKNHARLFNCLGVETQFVTINGVKSFRDFRSGDRTVVLTHTGAWKKAIVKCYGKQELHTIKLVRGRSSYTVRATHNHRWFLRDGTEVTELRVGDQLLAAKPIFGEFTYEKASVPERLYWAYGYVYGDGTCVTDDRKNKVASMVRLCKKDHRFLGRFREMGFSDSRPLSAKGDTFVYSGTYLKTLPDLQKDSPELIRAFVAGWLDADGHKNRSSGRADRFNGIQITGAENCNWLRKALPMAGQFILSEKNLTHREPNFGKRNATTIKFTLKATIGKTASPTFSVKSISPTTSKEEVWCLEVAGDRSFVLPFGLSTGNCSFSPVDRVEFFREYFFLLLAGTGCGFSVQRHHVDRLPALPMRGEEMELTVIHHAIEDTIEGWADALHFLLRSHIERFKVEFNYSAIRPRGSALRTAGGKAPGHLPLKQSLLEADAILAGAAGRKLRPIEVYDICMFTARAVLSGGIRRSATICLFSPDDQEMMDAKTGNWFEKHPQRSASNNSAVLSRAGTDVAQFRRLFSAQKEFGEPGFYFADHQDYGCNPCCEIGLHPVIEGSLSESETTKLRALGYSGPLEETTRLSGWQMCVAGDTQLLTYDGITNIREAVGKKIRIWNGQEWATVKPFVTGYNRTLYRVHLSDGTHLDCTAEHNWPIRLYGCVERKLSTSEMQQYLAKGTRLSIPRAKVVHPKVGVSIAHAYEYGFVLGDGTAAGDRVPFATCFKDEALLEMDGTYGAERVSGASRLKCKNIYFYSLDRTLAALIKEPKRSLPTEMYSWDEASILAFVAGWIDADGSKANNGCRLYGEKAKLQSAQLLLTKCGINSSLNLCAAAGEIVRIEGREVKRLVDLHYLQIPNASRIPTRRLDLSIGSEPTMKGKYQTVRRIEKLEGQHTTYCFTEPKRHMGLFGNVLTYQCNLSTINGAALQTVDDFLVACIQAAVIGTVQASYTVIPYLGPVTRYLNERDALLGVSVCGFMDNPEILFNPEVLERGARLCRATNEIVAQTIGIRSAARVTCVKPEGTASLLLGAASGIHPHHARHYFRRVQANRRDAVYRHFRATNPHMTEASVYRPETDDVITFAVEAPAHAILRDEVGAVDFLRFVQLVQRYWVLCGEAAGSRSPGLHHNVSNTCSVKPGEWDAVSEFIWLHREDFTGVALLGYEGDKRYPQAPREEVIGEDDLAKWNRLRYETVNYTRLEESTDETKLKEVAACAGGACELT